MVEHVDALSGRPSEPTREADDGGRAVARAPRTATCRRRRSCRSGRRRRSRALDPDELRGARRRRSCSATRTTCTSGPGRSVDRRARRAAPLHGLGRADPDRLGRLPGLLAARHAARVDDDGVTFRSVYDGAPTRFTPELAAAIQREPRLRHRDVPRHLPARRRRRARELEEAVRRTTLWAERQRARRARAGQLLFGIAQGGTDPELRRRSIEEIAELGFDGYALGGLAVGEDRDAMFDDGRLGRARSCPPTGRATSWASATPRASSR